MHSIRIFRHYMRLSLIVIAGIESIIFATSFYLSVHLRWWFIGTDVDSEPTGLLTYSLFVALVFVMTMGAMGLYEANLREGMTGSLIRILMSLMLGSLILAAASYFFPPLGLWRSILSLTVGLSLVFVVSLRLLFYYTNPGIFKRRILVFGDSPLADKLMIANQKRLDIVGYIPTTPEQSINNGMKVIPHDKPLMQIAVETQADEIVLAIHDRRGKLPIEELLECRMSGIQILEQQDFFERELGVIKLELLKPSWLVHSDGFQHGVMTTLIKRLFDVLISLIFIALLWPVMLLTALAIFVESGFRHSVLYRQMRIGENGVPFEVVKFRSMRVDAEADGKARWATTNDSRITRVGRFIRKARIDELPQIFNVLKGEMSFVGPRPERPEFVADFARKYEYYAARHRLKPGLTGWAQLSYPYGNTEEDALRKLEYDLYYIKNQSTFLDLLILVETVEVVLFGKGAV
ncbi:TIGR03013 family XrtA/PEP-CTERM system glycosyltransferase [Thiocystis violascens]|uniref:Sugar transferase, PEP-CTERM system associated/exopolysaccharide biosynthesis polyprenyl glycosylphosphotransferase n=1 Tax=Thiocystis violascens (strain ATCC 17096 / DSM 198 / 6111) TaxID=765911 RepID=I3YGH4_THIV6|nr:TIGR03013 family XrtA/PEP-CTERM system glycosyltransferase [Thiocystis violascens]AFL76092.1 sugar transferase, PEP-CTERM system associated/exopolysaccharide biosynthesis polyprenyl glycosylphosphotransferase [Thiocystis violascens DSM 198]